MFFCLQLTNLVFLRRIYKTDNVSLQHIFNRMPLLKFRYIGSNPSDDVSILTNETFAIISTQPIFMKDEHWIMIANSCQKCNLQTL